MTAQELSSYLNINVKTIYYFVRKGSIPHYRIGKLVRFRQDEIDKWLVSRKAKTLEINVDKLVRSVYTPNKGKPGHLNVKEVIDCCINEARSGG